MTTNYTFNKTTRAKALLLLALLTLLSASTMQGQNGIEMTVTIGDINVSSTTSDLPFQNSFERSLTQQIFTADDIRTSGVITSIAFYYSQSDFYLPNVQVYMKHTDKYQFDSDTDMVPISDLDLVFEGAISASEGGWITLTLDTPFYYDGHSNLLLCCYKPISDNDNNGRFYCHSTGYYTSIVYDSSLDYWLTQYRAHMRNNIQLHILSDGFLEPTSLAVDDITDISATLTWDAPLTDQTVTGYGYKYRQVGDADWSDEVTVGSTTTSVILSELSDLTAYQFRVKALYMGGEESVYANIEFTTLASLPALAVSDVTDMSATLSWEAPQTSYILTGYAYQYKKNSDVNWSTEVAVGSTTTSVTISGLTSGTNYQFRAKPLYSDRESSYTTIGFTTLALPLPNLAVSEVTDVSATLIWDAPETSYTITGYAYQYKKSSDANWPNEVITTNTTVILNGLSDLTEYQFRAKTIFSDHESNYTTISFTTFTSLPYECGFEDGMAGWLKVDTHGSTGISSEESHTGDNSFIFHQHIFGEHDPQYLISPPFVGTDAMTVSFYHYTNTTALPSFQIGYSTTTDALTAFTWVETITTSWLTWSRYEHTFPEGTKYIAFSYDYVSDNIYYAVFLDDFSFEAYSPYAKPTNLAVSNLTDQSATLTWTAPNNSVTGYAYQYKMISDGTWSALTTTNAPSVTLNGLTANTFYKFRVKALYAGDHASTYESIVFQAEGGIEPLPHYQDFGNGMGSWRIVDGVIGTEIDKYNHRFYFNRSNSPQYLMSPQFDGNSALAATFSYVNLSDGSNSYTAGFSVGYSTTTKDTDAFIWSDTIRSSHQWQQYTDEFPVGTKYIAVKWISGYWLLLDNFIIEAPCSPPSDLFVSINDTIATVSWSSDADAWQLCLNDDDNYIEVSEPTYTITGLVLSTNYTVKVRSHCSGNSSEWSEWSPLHNFTVPVTTFPWTEDFNELTENGSIPFGWNNQEGTASPWCYTSNTNSYGFGASNSNGHNGSKCVRFDSFNSWSGRSSFLKTIRLALPAEPAMELSFWYRNPVGGDFSVYISTNGGVTHETALATGLTGKTHWTRIDPIDLSAYAGQEVVIVFKGTSNTQNDDAYIYLDDVKVMPPIQVLTLADNADNSGAISEVTGQLCDVVVDGHTLYRDGSWNTICLPFDLNDFRGTSLEGAIVKTLASSTYSDDVLTVNFTDTLTAIEAGKPYIAKWNPHPAPDLVIHSASEWDDFVNDVNMYRNLYRGKVVKLAADISVSTMVGTETCPFCGTFDGDGHTLTVHLNSTEQYLAPFRYADGVTICNLTVAGDITTSAKFAGGVVAHMTGTSGIAHCISNVTLNSSVNGDGTHGGFIAIVQKGATTITDCLFNGKFLMPNTTDCGGFVGWTDSDNGATVAINNCFFSATAISVSGNIFARAHDMSSVTITNSYNNCYSNLFNGGQNHYTSATGAALQALLGDGWEVNGDAVVPKIRGIYENIVNLTFPDVTVSNATANVTTTYADFIGSHAPISGNGLLFDAHNPNGHAQHAALDVGDFTNPGYSFAGYFIDAEMTTPATAIPFADDGTVTLYVEGLILTLDNDTDNTGIIGENDGQLRNVVLTDRTLYKDGNWNTLCLPFNLDDLSGTPLEGATVKTLASSTYSDDVLTMNFTDTLSAIEAGKPYIVKWDPFADADLVIRTADDWDAFAYNVSHAINYYQGKTVKLAADISVTTMVGTTTTQFRGTFDGCGHTLTVNYTATDQYCAPFCCIFAATIKNLRVAGTIHTDYKYAAGLVAKVYGDGYALRIQNCRSSVDIISSTVGDGTHGGFIAVENSSATVYFNDCVFDGSITGSQTESCGGFIGWRDGYGILRLTNCLMAGTMDIVLDSTSAVFCRNGAASTVRITNCYYKGEFGSATPQGTYTDATGTALQALLGDAWMVRNGEVVPKVDYNIENPMFTDVTISSATTNVTTDYANFIGSYAPFSDNGVLFDAHNPNGDAQYAALGIGEIDTPTGNTLTSWYTDAELTAPATSIPFADDGTVTLYAKSWPDEGDECTINNTWEWNLFCDALQDNDTYDRFIGKTVKLGADISVTRMAGSSGHEFGGTFDGQGHTLTVSYQNNNGTVRTAPFSYVNGATIQNLIVAGNITGTASRAAGIVGETGSSLSHVTNCVCSVNVSGGSYTGGISVGGKVEITGCVFNGTITGTSMSGGFVGWSTSSLVISGCLFAPQEGSTIDGGTFYYNGGGEITPINSYYTVPLGTPQGIQAITNEMARPAGEAINIYDVSGITTYVNGMLYGDIFYYDPDKNFSVEGDVYTIHTATGWDFFCEALQDNDTYNRFIGKTVKLGADISVTRMAGGSYHDFMGTFDGQGHTLTVSYGSASSPIATDKAAPFVNVEVGCIIKNLHVAGDIYTSAKYAGGLVGTQYGAVSIENCHISTIIHSSTEGDGTHGGIVGLNGGGSSSSLTITGCLFDGKLLTSGTTTNCGGLVGWRNGTCTIGNSLYAPAVIAEGETEVLANACATFCRNGATALTNSYYTRTLGTEQGFPAISNPAITPVGEPTGTYNVSGLIAYVNGLMFGDTFYYNPERNFLLTIAGYGTGSGGWNLLASPIADTLSPTSANGFLTNAYDLYRFNPSNEGNEWENYKAANFSLENGKGYLYANSGNVTLVFGGTPYDGNGEVALVYDADNERKCWNLVGNPFNSDATVDREYYVLSSDGIGINPIAVPATTPVPPFTAVFVKAVAVGDKAVFTKVTQ